MNMVPVPVAPLEDGHAATVDDARTVRQRSGGATAARVALSAPQIKARSLPCDSRRMIPVDPK